jgi:hypothetical protein
VGYLETEKVVGEEAPWRLLSIVEIKALDEFWGKK